MDKKYALLFAILISGLIICDVYVFKSIPAQENNRESVIIQRVVDGDTLKLEDGRTIRLLNINSPEKGAIGANLATDFLKKFENRTVTIEITGVDKYQRSLARIYAPDYLNLMIVSQGLASKFLVQEDELSDFSKAEESAIESSLGIWKKSEYFNCFDSSIDEINEKVLIINSCPQIKLGGWFLKDESRKTYTFGNIYFQEITLHSGKGIDNATDLFWGSDTSIWNNDRDSLYLFNSAGGIADYESYGY